MAEKPRDEHGHEIRDIHAPAIGWSAFGLAAALIVIAVAIRGMFAQLDSTYRGGGNEMKTPPEPALQTNSSLDLKQFKAHENEILNSYGWVNKQESVVRVPIERAMNLLAERGLPATQISSGRTPTQMRQEKANEEKSKP